MTTKTAADALAELRRECEYDPEGEGSVDDLIAYKDALEDALAGVIDSDTRALDELNRMLSAPEWCVSMLEDACAIVRSTGRMEIPGVDWPRH